MDELKAQDPYYKTPDNFVLGSFMVRFFLISFVFYLHIEWSYGTAFPPSNPIGYDMSRSCFDSGMHFTNRLLHSFSILSFSFAQSVRLRALTLGMNHPVKCSEYWGEIAEQELDRLGLPYGSWDEAQLLKYRTGIGSPWFAVWILGWGAITEIPTRTKHTKIWFVIYLGVGYFLKHTYFMHMQRFPHCLLWH